MVELPLGAFGSFAASFFGVVPYAHGSGIVYCLDEALWHQKFWRLSLRLDLAGFGLVIIPRVPQSILELKPLQSVHVNS